MTAVARFRGLAVVGCLIATCATAQPRNRATLEQTNSHAATQHGIAQYKSDPAKAVRSFAQAHALAPSPVTAFNLGTAQAAAGDRERASANLTAAMRDPRLAAAALFNRGTAALAAKSYDAAIRDYESALRLRPNDVATKRNLEIALVRKQAAESQRSSSGGKGGGSTPQQNQKQPQSASQQAQPKSDSNLDAILRSVQEQEKEELQRMHRGRQEQTHVGW